MKFKIAITIAVLSGCISCQKKIDIENYLINPEYRMICFVSNCMHLERTWFYSESLQPELKDGVLFLKFIGSKDDSVNFYTCAEDFHSKSQPVLISLVNKNKIIFEFDNSIDKSIFLNTELVTEKFVTRKETVRLKGKDQVSILVPPNSMSINSFSFYFTGEKGTIPLKAIYTML